MTSPIVERLRARADEQERNNSYPVDREWDREAANLLESQEATIERLSAELARAREVLRPFAKLAKGEPDNCILHTGSREFRAARQFIEKEPQG